MNDIEIVITSYNRWHLLKPCVESLINLIGTDYKITIIEDSAQEHMRQNITSTFGDKVNLIFNEQNIGQMKSIDLSYSQINSKYILKVEDDYLFHGNTNFINEAVDVLENNAHIHMIWLRHIKNYQASHGSGYMSLFENELLSTPTGTQFKLLNKGHCGAWDGFTVMPNISRMSDYKLMFPSGYDGAANGKLGVLAEFNCNVQSKNFNFRAAQLVNGCCETKHNETTYK